jgi:AcrR family transcriptional regulator
MTDRGGADTRAQLLAAAAEVFAQGGLRGARVQEIVQRAGISERMIYHHFGSKEGLYEAVLQDQWSRMQRAWWPAIERAATLEPREGLEAAFRAFFQIHLRERRLLLPLVLHEAMSGWTAVPKASLAELPAPLRALYERGRRQGVFRSSCTFELFYLTRVGSMAGVTLLGPRFEDLRDRLQDAKFAERLMNQVVELTLDGVTVHADERTKKRAGGAAPERARKARRRGGP